MTTANMEVKVNDIIDRKEYRRQFCGAIGECVVDIKAEKNKYSRYTNAVYQSIFGEQAEECRDVLRLEKKDRLRSHLYDSVLDLIASYECGLAIEINKEHKRLGRQLWKRDVDRLITRFEKLSHWVPLVSRARAEMGLRDISERGAIHPKLVRVNFFGTE